MRAAQNTTTVASLERFLLRALLLVPPTSGGKQTETRVTRTTCSFALSSRDSGMALFSMIFSRRCGWSTLVDRRLEAGRRNPALGKKKRITKGKRPTAPKMDDGINAPVFLLSRDTTTTTLIPPFFLPRHTRLPLCVNHVVKKPAARRGCWTNSPRNATGLVEIEGFFAAFCTIRFEFTRFGQAKTKGGSKTPRP